MVDQSADRDELATQILIAEFEFVSQLIPFYRRFEITALAGTGLVISAAVAAAAALISGDHPDRVAAAVVLGLEDGAAALMLLVEVMALTRLRRASGYDRARPASAGAAPRRAGKDVLCWELAPTDTLFEFGAEGRFWKRTLNTVVSSTPLIVAMTLGALGLTIGCAVVERAAAGIATGAAAVVALAVLRPRASSSPTATRIPAWSAPMGV